jgi:SAM-dependent methyltransferase
MPDPYASIAQTDAALQTRLAGVLELRAADPQQRAILNDYLSAIPLSNGAAALEIGCGTGAVTRVLAQLPGVKEAVGIDPSPVFIDQARALANDDRLSFHVGDGRATRPDHGVDRSCRRERSQPWLHADTRCRLHADDRRSRCRPAGPRQQHRRRSMPGIEERSAATGRSRCIFRPHLVYQRACSQTELNLRRVWRTRLAVDFFRLHLKRAP